MLVPAPDLPEALYREIGKRVSQLRGQLGVTQDVLGMFSGLTRASVANIEKGRQRISIHQLYQFADFLGVHPKDLLPDPAEVRQLRIVPEAEAAYLRKIKNYASGSLESPSREHRSKRRK